MGFGSYSADAVYKTGDLVYGISDFRPAMIASWKKTGFGDYVPQITTNTFIDSYSSLVGQGASTGKNKSFHEAIKKHNKYKDSFIQKSDYNVTEGKWSKTAWMWKRKSKGGLYWAAILEDRCVHFCLGGLTSAQAMSGIANKNYSFGNSLIDEIKVSGEKARLITGAELRWVFRNRDVKSVQKNVQFWRPSVKDSSVYEQCAAPWDWEKLESDQMYRAAGRCWGDYKPTKTYSEDDYF